MTTIWTEYCFHLCFQSVSNVLVLLSTLVTKLTQPLTHIRANNGSLGSQLLKFYSSLCFRIVFILTKIYCYSQFSVLTLKYCHFLLKYCHWFRKGLKIINVTVGFEGKLKLCPLLNTKKTVNGRKQMSHASKFHSGVNVYGLSIADKILTLANEIVSREYMGWAEALAAFPPKNVCAREKVLQWGTLCISIEALLYMQHRHNYYCMPRHCAENCLHHHHHHPPSPKKRKA